MVALLAQLAIQLTYTSVEIALRRQATRELVWLCVNLILEVGIFVYLLQLWLFHLKLVYLGQTTRHLIKKRYEGHKPRGCANFLTVLSTAFEGYYQPSQLVPQFTLRSLPHEDW